MKPKARLSNGKANPEYQKWYRTTEKGITSRDNYNVSDAARKVKKKYRQSSRGRMKIQERKYTDLNWLNNPAFNHSSDSVEFDSMNKSHMRFFDERGIVRNISMDEHFDRYGNCGLRDDLWIDEFRKQVNRYVIT